jgi:hypothetical protein
MKMELNYKIYRNNRQLKSFGAFESYERARQALRKYFRQGVRVGKFNRNQFGWWDETSHNPTMYTHLGYEIKRVA